MPQFEYKALTPEGQTITGQLTASARSEAVSQLRSQGVRPLRIQEAKNGRLTQSAASAPARKGGRSIKRKDIQIFTSQLAALLKAGIVLSQALDILKEEADNERMAALIEEIHHDITGGTSLSDSLAKHPREFSKLYCSMVRVGESGGILDVVLRQIAGFMESEAALRSNIVTAMAYPSLVVLVGLGSIFVLVWFVIPRLSDVFADFGGNLPFLTQVLISTSDFAVNWGWLIFLALGVGGYLLKRFIDTPQGRHWFDSVKENTPVLGTIFIKAEVARFSRTMAILVKSGIPVLSALNLVTDTTSSSVLAKKLRQVSDQVKKGEGIAHPLRETGFFPPMVTNLVSVGEQSGNLDEMLDQVAETYDVEVEQAIKRFITLFEPLVIVLMAIGVGGILFAFLLPIMNIGNVIQ